MPDEVGRTLRASSLGEVSWLEPGGAPRAAGVLPLTDDEGPVLALTLDRAALATSLGAAEEVVLQVRDPRNTAPGWQPLGLRCRTRLVPDLEGHHFREHLLREELRRFPPARRHADSPLLQREHWWYLPRLLVRLDVERVDEAPPPRTGPSDASLTTAADSRPVASGVEVRDGSIRTSWGPRPAPGRGALLFQDATVPDLEAWTWSVHDVVVDDGGRVLGEAPAPSPPRMPSLRARWRGERRLARSCAEALRSWRHDG